MNDSSAQYSLINTIITMLASYLSYTQSCLCIPQKHINIIKYL